MKFIMKVLTNCVSIRIIQVVIAYFGWNMTAVTIVNSGFNSTGFFLIVLAIFLRDIVNGLVWGWNKLGFNNE